MGAFILDKQIGFEAVIDREKSMIMGRLKKNEDFLEGILKVCNYYHVQTGTFSCIGSLLKVGYYQFERRPDESLYYSEPVVKNDPAELLSGTGFIGLDEAGELEVHYHGMYVDKDGVISGGHFIRGKNPTAVTLEFMIHYSNNIHVQRKLETNYNIPIFHFSERRS